MTAGRKRTLRYAATPAALGLVLGLVLTGCGGKGDEANGPDPRMQRSSPTPTPSPSRASTKPSGKTIEMPQLTTAQAVAALKRTGFTCGTDVAYAICKSGVIEVWLLTGDHKRFPVVSLHSTGAVPAARKAIGGRLTAVLRTVHVNETDEVDTWYEQQGETPTAEETIGDWKVALSAEEGSDSPGVHLTLNDRRCKTDCQAE